MTMLIGIYLLQVQILDMAKPHGTAAWMASWTLFRSPTGRRNDWEPLVQRETSATYVKDTEARHAALEQGISFARQLQGDDCLEPMRWDEPAPSFHVESARLKRACAIH